MVKVTKEQAKENRQAMIWAADRSLRENGYDGLSTAGVAAAAGLTQGALFRHFGDKETLAAEAVGAGFAPILALLDRLPEEGGLRGYVEAYLAADHRDHFPWGCPVGAMGAEMHRHPEAVARAFADGLEANIDALERLTGDRARAAFVLSALAGGIAIARALRAAGQEEASDAHLAAVRDHLLA
ncbi:TetR family transcriptional regulator [Rhodobacterales bacterium HKCCE3408]|nr:TetR family transcriptional regulator [Rhodobacterales bacterium HKCCE3408]